MKDKMKIVMALAVIVVSGNSLPEVQLGNPLLRAHPCKGSEEIDASFSPGLNPEENNEYFIFINKNINHDSKIHLILNEDANVTLNDENDAEISHEAKNYMIKFLKDKQGIGFKVKGLTTTKVPYITSLVIDSVEYCSEPFLGFLDAYVNKDLTRSF